MYIAEKRIKKYKKAIFMLTDVYIEEIFLFLFLRLACERTTFSLLVCT